MKKITPFKRSKLLLPALFALAVCALLASCENILEAVPRKDTGGVQGRARGRRLDAGRRS